MVALSVVGALALSLPLGLAMPQYQNTATGTAAVAAAAATAVTVQTTSKIHGKAFDRFVVIWLENTDYDKAVGDPNLAWLASKGVTLSNYFGVTHPSEPNYVAAIGGDYFGMDNDNLNFVPNNISTVIDLLEDKKISWAEYQEDMPYTGFEGFSWVNQKTKANDYVRKHNPAIIYNSVTERTDRLANIKNLTMFYKDLNDNKLPQWMFITPNMTSDGHDTSVTVAGTWSRNFLEPLLNDKRFMDKTLVLLTFDENHTYTQQNRVMGILLGDVLDKKLIGTTDSNFYNHYSEISTVQANWVLHNLGRWDVGANVFSAVADKTDSKVRQFTNPPLSQMFYNTSYAGLFNSKNSSVPLPPPKTVGSFSGRTTLSDIKDVWQSQTKQSFYDTRLEIPDGMHPPPGY